MEIFDSKELEQAQPDSSSSEDVNTIIVEAIIHPRNSNSSSEKFKESSQIKRKTHYETSEENLIEFIDNEVMSKEKENAEFKAAELSAIEERDFLSLKLAGQTVRALCDQGSQKSYINQKFTEKFKDKLQPHNSLNVGAFEGQSLIEITGKIKVALSVGTTTSDLELRVSPDPRYDVILGKDFLIKYDIDVRNQAGLWRSGKRGKWCKFNTGENQTGSTIFAECASLVEISPSEWQIIENLVDEELKRQECVTLGKCKTMKHRVTLIPEAEPLKHYQRRMSPAIMKIAKEEVERMLKEDIIEPSDGAWSSAPVIVKKKNGQYRFCVDFRDVNQKIVKDRYQVPPIDGILDKLREAQYILTLEFELGI